jgi:putative transposase
VIAAILHRQATGCPWRTLPDQFPPWQTVYSYHRRWLKDGTLRKIRDAARDGGGGG